MTQSGGIIYRVIHLRPFPAKDNYYVCAHIMFIPSLCICDMFMQDTVLCQASHYIPYNSLLQANYSQVYQVSSLASQLAEKI